MQQLPALIGMTLPQLRDVAEAIGAKPFAAKQIAHAIYTQRVTSIDEITTLSKQCRENLSQLYSLGLTPPLTSAESVDGTVKYLFPGAGGRDIESVYIPDRDRATLCVSSQAGCKMKCSFCMTGKLGFQGNLTAAQIINQVLAIPQSSSLTNIVFMGMGEPLDNLAPLLQAIEVLTAPWGLAWSPKRITVSSIGKLKELKQLLDLTKVHIAISVHNPFAEERGKIMPSERAWSINAIMDLLRQYDWSHQRRLSLEYILWKGVNDSPRYANALARLIGNLECRVNLIRFHAIPGSELLPPSRPVMEAFRDILNDLNVTATIRASRGEDIIAACGMLAGKGDNINDK